MKGREEVKENRREGKTERRGSIHTCNLFLKCKEYSEENNFKHIIRRPNAILFHESIFLMRRQWILKTS